MLISPWPRIANYEHLIERRLDADASIEQATESLAALQLYFQEVVFWLVERLSPARLLEIADRLEDQTGCVGFRSAWRDRMAALLRAKAQQQHWFEAARRSGASCWCPVCGADCNFGPVHEARYRERYPETSADELEVRQMHRNELEAELLHWRRTGAPPGGSPKRGGR